MYGNVAFPSPWMQDYMHVFGVRSALIACSTQVLHAWSPSMSDADRAALLQLHPPTVLQACCMCSVMFEFLPCASAMLSTTSSLLRWDLGSRVFVVVCLWGALVSACVQSCAWLRVSKSETGASGLQALPMRIHMNVIVH